ncbi:MAG TPA: hypothetical protein ENG63_03480 [Candidatus Desulfofervidus auxilii]|uniref:Uncharacterized protein n=1 Tax=Desulfofervidus auxilii TaxID=1621989 RepID=A0A7C0Y253_DESA2|nr:hypothetical protein [Candidatus Desulfofervidus auxilii]
MLEEIYYLLRDIIDLEKYIKNRNIDIVDIRYKLILKRAKKLWKSQELEKFKEERLQRLVEYVEKDYKQ